MSGDTPGFDEDRLLEKLRAIEALFAGATTPGERLAAAEAKRRIQLRLKALEESDPAVVYRFTVGDGWSARLLMALCRRYGLTPFRYRGQRRTTLNVKVSRRFADETLWPEFQQLSAVLRQHIDDLTDRVIMTAIHGDVSDATEAAKPPELGSAGSD
jgi:hypothetical protein